jgi:hypothetical protein
MNPSGCQVAFPLVSISPGVLSGVWRTTEIGEELLIHNRASLATIIMTSTEDAARLIQEATDTIWLRPFGILDVWGYGVKSKPFVLFMADVQGQR